MWREGGAWELVFLLLVGAELAGEVQRFPEHSSKMVMLEPDSLSRKSVDQLLVLQAGPESVERESRPSRVSEEKRPGASAEPFISFSSQR